MQQIIFSDLIFLSYLSLDVYLVYQRSFQTKKTIDNKKKDFFKTTSLDKKKKESDNDDTDEHISAA